MSENIYPEKAKSSVNPLKGMQKASVRILLSYLSSTLFIGVFAVIYNHFGHGVESLYMNFAWIWPAIGLALSLVFLLSGHELSQPGRIFLSLGLATLTIGFILRGVFEIAGTDSPFMPVFFIAGTVVLVLSVIFLIPGIKQNGGQQQV